MKKQADTAGKTENFATRNVRTITFLICLAVFLAVAGPVSIFRIMEYVEDNREIDSPMSKEDILHLAAKGKYVTWKDITAFSGNTLEFSSEIHYQIQAEKGKYLLYAAKSKNTGEILYLTLTRFPDNQTVDMLSDDVVAFLNQE